MLKKLWTQGVEVNLKGCLTDYITAKIAYTYLDTEDKLTGEDLLYKPDHKLAAGIDYKIPKADARLHIETFYTGKRLWQESSRSPIEKLDDYWIFSATASKEIGKHAEVFVKVDNVFDKKDVVDEYFIDGREFFAGVKVNL